MRGLKYILLLAAAACGAVTSDSREYVVRVRGTVSSSLRAELEGHGVAITSYMGKGRYKVYGSEDSINALKSHSRVASVSVRHAAQKLASHIKEGRARMLKEGQAEIGLVALLVNIPRSDEELASAVAELTSDLGEIGVEAEIQVDSSRKVSVSVPAELERYAVHVLSKSSHVTSVEHQPEYHLFNANARWITQGLDNPTSPVSTALGLSGEGEIVGVADTGLDYGSCFFRDDVENVVFGSGTTANFDHRKIVQYNDYTDRLDESGGHGTHVCGSVAGNSLSSNSDANGMAPDAKLAFFDVARPGDQGLTIPTDLHAGLFPDAYALGARLHSNSWGDSQSSYSSNAEEVDRFIWEHPDFLVLVAAGNSGENGLVSLGSPSTSKNGVCVGATNNEDSSRAAAYEEAAYFSSLGPTSDGRLKPDVMAPGHVIVSANSDNSATSETCSTVGMSGTSMATPVTAGLSALVREYFSKGFYPSGAATAGDAHAPSGALVKAMLIGSGQALWGPDPAPSVYQGYGRVRLETVLRGADADFDLFVSDDASLALDTAEIGDYCFNVDSSQDFKVTLVWSDAPGEPYTDDVLVNDLSLVVTTSAGGKTFGNHRTPAAEVIIAGSSVGFAHATFGATLDISPPLQAELVVLPINVETGCDPLTTDLTGKIVAMENYNDCAPVTRVVNAQNAGALAVIFNMGSGSALAGGNMNVEPSVMIPVVSVASTVSWASGDSASIGVESWTGADSVNNVEQVRINAAGLVTVAVIGAEVANGPQPYALVVTGSFTESTECAAADSCLLCGNGDCEAGECVCHDGWYGVWCSNEICPNDCSGNGQCDGEVCLCNEGFFGDDCGESSCGGVIELTETRGSITHDVTGGEYNNNANCQWIVTPPAGSGVHIKFTLRQGYSIEDDFDFLYLIQGRNWYDPIIAVATGSGNRDVVTTSFAPFALVWFTSDSSVTESGFVLDYEVLECWDDCSGEGSCVDGQCECDAGHYEMNCEDDSCCSSTSCGSGGHCTSACQCQCDEGFFGVDSCSERACFGMQTYVDASGSFGDGSGRSDYESLLYCGFWIKPTDATTITLDFNSFATEQGWDFVRVYSDLLETELLDEFSGSLSGQRHTYPYGTLKVVFSSDENTVESGFSISYTSDGVDGGNDDVNTEDDDATNSNRPPVFAKSSYAFEVPRKSPSGTRLDKSNKVFVTDAEDGDITDITSDLYVTINRKGRVTFDGTRLKRREGPFPMVLTACDSEGLCSSVPATLTVL